jgi:hypothetical protein
MPYLGQLAYPKDLIKLIKGGDVRIWGCLFGCVVVLT